MRVCPRVYLSGPIVCLGFSGLIVLVSVATKCTNCLRAGLSACLHHCPDCLSRFQWPLSTRTCLCAGLSACLLLCPNYLSRFQWLLSAPTCLMCGSVRVSTYLSRLSVLVSVAWLSVLVLVATMCTNVSMFGSVRVSTYLVWLSVLVSVATKCTNVSMCGSVRVSTYLSGLIICLGFSGWPKGRWPILRPLGRAKSSVR